MSAGEPVDVLFRTALDEGDVTAIFDNTDEYPNLQCYAHLGQHSTATIEWVEDEELTRASTRDEYAPLLAELGRIGYDVTVVDALTKYHQ
ncbi:Uncharacterised protein [Mycobacteroides abscessus subsp. abscessus]|jgi:hypothetical protein|uniref:hypothetical protein n=1 Tax=Mycobacteroides abscessus TaxID=36809 RepID=UPI000927FE0B|nr:hypothetical protein [Mycobacteroides abscessus]SIH22760.1 Uncharacterised protein [Mycobacteroides abscessus subsp. abscessus]